MKKYLKILIPVFIIILTIVSVKIIMENPSKAKRGKKSKVSKVSVEVLQIREKKFTPFIESYGLVESSIKTSLISQVSGKVVYVNSKFKDGTYFKKGETLIKIEDIEYKANFEIARSKLILAKQTLLEEQAKSKQAKQEWKNLNNNLEANPLVLRTPQLESAKANLESAKAELSKAKLALDRTVINAPYDGRVIKKNINISQVISSNANLADIYALDSLKVRLPIKNKDLAFLDLEKKIEVDLYSNLTKSSFKGFIQRSESVIDPNLAQLYVIADIPWQKGIYIGEYLTAKIISKPISNTIVIPNSSIYQGSYVYTQKDGIVTKKDVSILWEDDQNSIISNGLDTNDSLVITPLGAINSGTAVNILGEQK